MLPPPGFPNTLLPQTRLTRGTLPACWLTYLLTGPGMSGSVFNAQEKDTEPGESANHQLQNRSKQNSILGNWGGRGPRTSEL